MTLLARRHVLSSLAAGSAAALVASPALAGDPAQLIQKVSTEVIELIKTTVDGMAERGFGRIINITSGAVKAPIDVLGLSNGARSGLTGFVAGVARQSRLASRNVTINNLLPGAFDTDRIRTTLKGAAEKAGKSVEEIAEVRKKTIPAQRFGNADEFGKTCAFLCSVHASYITGQNILTDGGAYPGTY